MFRVAVVEPRNIEPPRHADIFQAAIALFIPSESHEYRDASDSQTCAPGNERFDLLSFPEAFLPSDTLLQTLRSLDERRPSIGCIHTGVRPNAEHRSSHLFRTAQLAELLNAVESIESVCRDDLTHFRSWLKKQPEGARFNLGCMFTVDVDATLRICFHVKAVRSLMEFSPLPDDHMTEANLLSLVTLRPTSNRLLSVTIQPLICSDVLDLHTDVVNKYPLDAVTSQRACFMDCPSEHVDIVSVVACTRNKTIGIGTTSESVKWHRKFREAFKISVTEERRMRHQYAAFVLSNFRRIESGQQNQWGSLSGIFVPQPVPRNNPYCVDVSSVGCVFGKFPDSASDDDDGASKWVDYQRWNQSRNSKVLGYILGLDPIHSEKFKSEATMFSFVVNCLPRDANRWTPIDTLSRYLFYDTALVPGVEATTLQFEPRRSL